MGALSLVRAEPGGKYRSQWQGHLIAAGTGGPRVLVDMGKGPGPHGHTGKPGELLGSLNLIDAVAVTRCHRDRIGWKVTWRDASPRPVFPSRNYYLGPTTGNTPCGPATGMRRSNAASGPSRSLGGCSWCGASTSWRPG